MSETPRRPKRLVLCRGQFCNMDGRADDLRKAIDPLIDDLNGADDPPRIRLATANCLSMCGAGPNCIVQPGGKPFNHLTADTLRRIIHEELDD